MKSFEIVTMFSYKGRIMKLFKVRKVMVLVSVSIHEARISCTFFGGLKTSRRWKLKKYIIIKSNELNLLFSEIVSKGFWCDKVWGILIFSSCTPIHGIYRKSLLITMTADQKLRGSVPKSGPVDFAVDFFIFSRWKGFRSYILKSLFLFSNFYS